jgi:hypothetical protein
MKLTLNIYENKSTKKRIHINPELDSYTTYRIYVNSKKKLFIVNKIYSFIRISCLLLVNNNEINYGTYIFILIDFFHIIFGYLIDILIKIYFSNKYNFSIRYKKIVRYVLYYMIFSVLYECYYFLYGTYLLYNYYKNILTYNILLFIIISKIGILILINFCNNKELNINECPKELFIDLHTSKVGIIESNNKCGICLEKFIVNEKVIHMVNCAHYYHTDCILSWLKKNKTSCPMCRESILNLN